MTIMEIAKIDNVESDEYRNLVHGINNKFEDLYKTLNRYAIKESSYYIGLAYKYFEKAVDNELRSRQ